MVISGIISAFVYPEVLSLTMLSKAGIEGVWAPIMLYGAAVTNVMLGRATLVTYRITLIGLVQIGIIVLYTVIVSFSQPEQWLHPFGPVTKNLLLSASILVMIVLEKK